MTVAEMKERKTQLGYTNEIVKVNIKLLFFGGVNCRFWSNLSSPYHQTGACL